MNMHLECVIALEFIGDVWMPLQPFEHDLWWCYCFFPPFSQFVHWYDMNKSKPVIIYQLCSWALSQNSNWKNAHCSMKRKARRKCFWMQEKFRWFMWKFQQTRTMANYVDEVIKMYLVVKLCKMKHRLWSFNYS